MLSAISLVGIYLQARSTTRRAGYAVLACVCAVATAYNFRTGQYGLVVANVVAVVLWTRSFRLAQPDDVPEPAPVEVSP